MDTLSLPHPQISSLDFDMDSDFEQSQDGVRWVASQSPNPALQALMREAEREKRSRRSAPAHEPTWAYPTPSTSLSASISASWQPSANSPLDASHLLPLSSTTSSVSSFSPFRASEPPIPRRAKPVSAGQRRPLASSTSSANQPLRGATRSRSSSHSTALSLPSTSNTNYASKEELSACFDELLKDMTTKVDETSKKKQRLIARTKVKERSPGGDTIDDRTSLDANNLIARPLTKTSSASAIYSTRSSTKPIQLTSSVSLPISKPELCGRTLGKTASFGASGVEPVSRKSTPTSSQNHIGLSRDLKHPPVAAFNTHQTVPRIPSAPKPIPHDGDTTMLDLTDTESESEQPVPCRTDTIMDDAASDPGMDVSFIQPEPAPQPRVPPPKPKPQSLPSAPAWRPRAGPPPLGMRRAPQLQPSQYSTSQGSKTQFKPPLLAKHEAGGLANNCGSVTKPVATTSAKPALRGGSTRAAAPALAVRKSQDPDSSYDVSFDLDPVALEETMKKYDGLA